ncbi:hypothetical protein D021_1926B, partial [Vibrio parahaemolyticus 10296]
VKYLNQTPANRCTDLEYRNFLLRAQYEQRLLDKRLHRSHLISR